MLVATLFIPAQMTIIPLFLIWKQVGWLNTLLPLIVPSWFGHAFYIFLMRQFVMTIPLELDDAARIDGCGVLRIYWNIIVPLSTPALATIAIFSFQSKWNQFFEPLIYISKRDIMPLAVGVRMFRSALIAPGGAATGHDQLESPARGDSGDGDTDHRRVLPRPAGVHPGHRGVGRKGIEPASTAGDLRRRTRVKYVTFGSTGVQVSEMCLGTMMFGERCDEAESDRILSASLDAGVTFVDTAAAYGKGLTEEIVGRIIKGKRDRIFLGTKVPQKTDSEWIKSSIDESLKRLQVEYVDLYMIHWPRPKMDVTDMMAGLNAVVKAGQGSVRRLLQLPGLAVRPLQRDRGSQQLGSAGLQPDPVQPARARSRGRGAAAGSSGQGRHHRLPAAFDGRARLASIALANRCPRTRAGQPTPDLEGGWSATATESASCLLSRPTAGCTPRRYPSHGSSSRRASRAPSSAQARSNQVQATVKAFDIDFTDDEYAQLTAMFDTAVKEESGGNFVGCGDPSTCSPERLTPRWALW